MRRVLAAVFTVATLMVPSSALAQDEPTASLVEQVITAADTSLGDEATVAVLRAADRGYDLLQIIEGLLESFVAADGTITDDGGAVVTPTLAPAGVIADNDSPGAAGPAGGASRIAGGSGISGEQIAIRLLERGVGKTSAKLEKKDDLGERAAEYDTSVDVFTALAVLVLLDSAYSIEQIVLDGIMAQRIDVGFDGSVVILDDEGGVLRPDGDEPSFGDDVETATAVNTFIDNLTDAITGEDPLTASDGRFKRQYTLTVDVGFSDEEGSTGTIKANVNFGEIKDTEGHFAGRGTGTLFVDNQVGCSLSELNTTKYPYKIQVPVRVGVFASGKPGGKVTLQFGLEATAAAKVTAAGDSICLDVVRDTADVYAQFITLPNVPVQLRDGATAKTDTKAQDLPIDITLAVQIKEI